MHDQYQIPPPSSWEKFESLCRDIYAAELKDPNTQKNGRTGYPQHGVDVYGYTQDKRLIGVQCKKKDVEISRKIKIQELRSEVKKALEFNPKLSYFIFAATTPSDPKLSEIAREITSEHSEKGLFSVSYLGWDDILEKLVGHPELVSKYYSWALPGGDSNEYAFGLWEEQFGCNYLFKNACLIPFRSWGQVYFRPEFIVDLCSFCNITQALLIEKRVKNLHASLQVALENFRNIASDLIDYAYVDPDRLDAESDIYMYWVNKGDLPYHKQREYVEYKKSVLLHLFYGLIAAANYIIDIKNKISPNQISLQKYVKFCRNHDYRSAFEIPRYSEDNVAEGVLYLGLNWIKEKCAKEASDPVILFEKIIDSNQSTMHLF